MQRPAALHAVHPDAVGADRPADVLDPLLAGKVERQAELALQLVVGRARDQHAARLAELLQACRDVDAVAEQVVAFDHHVAEIDADAEDDAALGRSAGLLRGDTPSASRRRRHRIDDRAELDDGAVAHQLDDAAVVLGEQRIDDLGAKRLDRGERAGLVLLDQARIADDVGRHDGRQPPLGSSCDHRRPFGASAKFFQAFV